MTVPAGSAPPCTGTLHVATFEVESSAGLHITDKGFHVVGAAVEGLHYMAEARVVESERFRRRLGERFTRELRDALVQNARDLGLPTDDLGSLSVSGKLIYHEQHDVRFDERSGLGTEGKSTRVLKTTRAHVVVSDSSSGTIVAEFDVDTSGASAPSPMTTPKYGTSPEVWRVVEHLVRRRVRFQVPLAFAWSREVRAGLRAASAGDWQAATQSWTRATSASNATTRRAAHFNLFVAYELAGQLDQARTHLMAAQQEYPAPVGYTSTSRGGEPEGHGLVTPNDFEAHHTRLAQRELIERCEGLERQHAE